MSWVVLADEGSSSLILPGDASSSTIRLTAARHDHLVAERRRGALARLQHQEVGRVPRPVHEPPQQAEVPVERLELPAALRGQLPRPLLERPVRLDAHADEGQAPVVPGHRLQDVARVVLAVLRGERREVEAERAGLAGQAVGPAVRPALEPARRLEVRARPLVEVARVAGAAAEERRDAVVGAQEDERQRPRLEARRGRCCTGRRRAPPRRASPGSVASIAACSRSRIDAAALVVEALGQELDVHLARRARGEVAQLAEEDLAGDDAQAHVAPAAQRGSSFTATLRKRWKPPSFQRGVFSFEKCICSAIMPSVAPSFAWFAVSVQSTSGTSFSHTRMCGTSPSIRARSVFHSPFFQCFAQSRLTRFALVDALEPLAVDAADAAALEVVDHHLVGVARLVAAQEEPAVAAPVGVDLERDLEVAVLAVREQDPAVAGAVLGGEDDAVLHAPALAVAVVVHLADVPAGEVLPVEERREPGGDGGGQESGDGQARRGAGGAASR